MSRVLVIDDDLEILEVIETMLTIKGLKVKTEPCWENTFYEIKIFEPDLILIDIGLGLEDGRNITKRIKTSDYSSNIPVILFSGINGINKNMDGCLNDDFISKPFDLNDLFNKIQYQIHKALILKIRNGDKQITRMMPGRPDELINLFYDKYASSLFGYILSIVKDEGQSEKILIKVFTEFYNRINFESKESMLIQGIKIANKTIMEITHKERQSFLLILKKNNEIQNN